MQEGFVFIAFVAAALVLAASVSARPATSAGTLAAASATTPPVSPLLQMHEMQPLLGRADLRVLDIRADRDYAAGHIPGAVNTPYSKYRRPADSAGARKG